MMRPTPALPTAPQPPPPMLTSATNEEQMPGTPLLGKGPSWRGRSELQAETKFDAIDILAKEQEQTEGQEEARARSYSDAAIQQAQSR